VPAAARAVGGDDDVHRGVEDRLDLHFPELLGTALGQRLRIRLTLAHGEFVQRAPGLLAADDHEVPRLGVADTGRGMGGFENAQQDVVRNGVAAEAVADVAPLAHDPEHGLTFRVVVRGRGHGRGRCCDRGHVLGAGGVPGG
jgi:hypothetical protein